MSGANIRRTTTSTYSDATPVFTGKSAIPKLRGGFRLNVGIKSFDIAAQFSYSLGGYVYDNGYSVLMNNRNLIGSDNWHTDIRDAWKEPGDVTNVPRLSAGYGPDIRYNAASSRFLTKADYLSLNNVNIGYTLPTKVAEDLKLSKFRIYVSGDNLLMFSARKGLNPSTLFGGSNSGIYAPMTTFSLGAKIEF